MRGVLLPATPAQIGTIFSHETVYCSAGRNMNETGHPLRVFLYETKNGGGRGLVVGEMWIGPGYEMPKRSSEAPKGFEIAARTKTPNMAYAPEARYSAAYIGAAKSWFYEILFVQCYTVPVDIARVVWRGSTKAPRVWKYIEC